MAIEWAVLAEVLKPTVGAVAGIWLKDWLEKKPKVITFYGSLSTHQVSPPATAPFRVHTHEVVVRNVGKKPATNIRLMHATLPDFHLFPYVAHTVGDTAGGGREIVLPRLVPGEQVTVSYLYWPPLIAGNVNSGVKHDDGFAEVVDVELQRRLPKWLTYMLTGFALLGMVALVYLLALAGIWLYGRFG